MRYNIPCQPLPRRQSSDHQHEVQILMLHDLPHLRSKLRTAEMRTRELHPDDAFGADNTNLVRTSVAADASIAARPLECAATKQTRGAIWPDGSSITACTQHIWRLCDYFTPDDQHSSACAVNSQPRRWLPRDEVPRAAKLLHRDTTGSTTRLLEGVVERSAADHGDSAVSSALERRRQRGEQEIQLPQLRVGAHQLRSKFTDFLRAAVCVAWNVCGTRTGLIRRVTH